MSEAGVGGVPCGPRSLDPGRQRPTVSPLRCVASASQPDRDRTKTYRFHSPRSVFCFFCLLLFKPSVLRCRMWVKDRPSFSKVLRCLCCATSACWTCAGAMASLADHQTGVSRRGGRTVPRGKQQQQQQQQQRRISFNRQTSFPKSFGYRGFRVPRRGGRIPKPVPDAVCHMGPPLCARRPDPGRRFLVFAKDVCFQEGASEGGRGGLACPLEAALGKGLLPGHLWTSDAERCGDREHPGRVT